MKLCRFELLDSPDIPRSGIYHEQHVYEADGMQAVGIHDLSKVKFLPPLGQPRSVRAFEALGRPEHPQRVYYTYINPSEMSGLLSEVPLPELVNELDFEIRIAAIIKDIGDLIDPQEAQDFILGYTILIEFIDYQRLAEEQRAGIPPCQAHDFSLVAGPFITTIEELDPLRVGNPEDIKYKWAYEISINNSLLYKAEIEQPIGFSEMLGLATKTRKVFPGEVFCAPQLLKPKLTETELKRGLREGDQVSVRIDPLGTLIFKIV